MKEPPNYETPINGDVPLKLALIYHNKELFQFLLDHGDVLTEKIRMRVRFHEQSFRDIIEAYDECPVKEPVSIEC
jgi:hypothetical protein